MGRASVARELVVFPGVFCLLSYVVLFNAVKGSFDIFLSFCYVTVGWPAAGQAKRRVLVARVRALGIGAGRGTAQTGLVGLAVPSLRGPALLETAARPCSTCLVKRSTWAVCDTPVPPPLFLHCGRSESTREAPMENFIALLLQVLTLCTAACG